MHQSRRRPSAVPPEEPAPLSRTERIKIRAALRLHLSDAEKGRNAFRVMSQHVPTDEAAQLAMEVGSTDGETPLNVLLAIADEMDISRRDHLKALAEKASPPQPTKEAEDRPGDLNYVRRPNREQEMEKRARLMAENDRVVGAIEANIVASIAVHQYMRRRRESAGCRFPRRVRVRRRGHSARRAASRGATRAGPGRDPGPKPAPSLRRRQFLSTFHAFLALVFYGCQS